MIYFFINVKKLNLRLVDVHNNKLMTYYEFKRFTCLFEHAIRARSHME